MILEKIAAAAKKRVEKSMEQRSLAEVINLAKEMPRGSFEFRKALENPGMSFICEIKKASPSRGIIAEDFPYLAIAREYESAGASAVSVLTETDFFLGSPGYLEEIHKEITLPLLRKDFIIHEYQIYEAKLLGASAVLLICALLDTDTLKAYINICHELGLDALVEAHHKEEVASALMAGADIIGVNNRNLKTFEVNLENALELRRLVPPSVVFVAESGIRDCDDVKRLHEAGVHGVLIGETLMRAADKKAALDSLRRGL